MRKAALCVLVFLLAGALPAMAKNNGFYIGGSIGQSTLKVTSFSDNLGDLSFNDSDNGYKVFLGYRFLHFLAVEGSYVDFGTPKDTVAEGVDAEIKLNGYDAFALGILPLGPVDLFAKLGVISWDSDIKAIYEEVVDRQSDSGTDAAYGIGAAFKLGSIAIRGEFEMFQVENSDDVYMVSLGISYTF